MAPTEAAPSPSIIVGTADELGPRHDTPQPVTWADVEAARAERASPCVAAQAYPADLQKPNDFFQDPFSLPVAILVQAAANAGWSMTAQDVRLHIRGDCSCTGA